MRISDWSSDVCSSDRGDLAGAGVRRGDRRERLSRHRRTGALGSRAAAAGYCAASATGGALAETSTVLAAPGSRIEWVTPCERHVLSNDPPSCCLMMRWRTEKPNPRVSGRDRKSTRLKP